tara:strand:- start:2918 stop:3940 length:1023 start_codon:yes stop_codon:yes gene_type:complete
MQVEAIELDNTIIKKVCLKHQASRKPLWITLEKGRADYNLKIIDRFSPFEAIACEWVLSEVYSEMSQFIVPKRGQCLRVLAADFQEILWNINYLKNIFSSLEEEIYIQHCLYLRDMLLDLQEMWMGGRVLPQYLTVSGVERDFTVGIQAKLQNVLKSFEKDFMSFHNLVHQDHNLLNRMNGVMRLPKEVVQALDLGGLNAYSCGMASLNHKSYGFYPELEQYSPSSDLIQNDAKSRFLIAFDWIRFNLIQLNKIMTILPEGNFDLKEKPVYEPLLGYFVSKVIAPSGPLYANYIYKKVSLSSSSTRLKPFLEQILEGQEYEDLPLAIASLAYDEEQGVLV